MRIIITGVSGMVGEGVLDEAIRCASVSEILIITRKPLGYDNPKVKELILPDFLNIGDQLKSIQQYDACLFCLGVSSVGMKKELYERLTYDLTIGFAKALLPNNPAMTFLYISGGGTDSTEKGRIHWARIKGRTENELMKMGFKSAYCLRPGYLHPTPGMKHTHSFYRFIGWVYHAMNFIAPNTVNTLSQLAKAMLYLSQQGYSKKIISIADINLLSAKYDQL